MSLDAAAIESHFELPSAAGNGRVLWRASGVPSVMERATRATVLAAFSPRARYGCSCVLVKKQPYATVLAAFSPRARCPVSPIDSTRAH